MTTMEDLTSRAGDARDSQLMMTEPKLRAAMVSTLRRRTGHARFRRGPVVAQQQPSSPDNPSASSSLPSTTLTSITAGGEASVSGADFSARLPSAPTSDHAAGRPPVQSSAASDWAPGRLEANRRARSENDAAHGGHCHCSKKRRKSRVKKVVRVPAISSRNADIPPDDYSWRKYGQKPIKGSPYPRGYYKCSTVRGCPARKHVERDPGEPAMLIVTYEGDHRHVGGPNQRNENDDAITPA